MKRLLFRYLSQEQKEKFKHDCSYLNVVEVAAEWDIYRDTVYKWARKMGVGLRKTKRSHRILPSPRPIAQYKGFGIYKYYKYFRIEGSTMAHTKLDVVKKFIDTYIRRTSTTQIFIP